MDINELLRAVHSLFSKASQLDLEKRTARYKQHSSRDLQRDIATPLSDYIDKLASGQSSHAHNIPHTIDASTDTDIHITAHQQSQQLNTTAGGASSNLTEYLRAHPVNSDTDSYIGNKLQASTWAHIHTAILKAREGDERTAKLHATIANQAMKEAGHFMNDEEFKKFSDEIEKVLNELK